MPQKILIVVDMQNDFVDGSLGTPEAQAVPVSYTHLDVYKRQFHTVWTPQHTSFFYSHIVSWDCPRRCKQKLTFFLKRR